MKRFKLMVRNTPMGGVVIATGAPDSDFGECPATDYFVEVETEDLPRDLTTHWIVEDGKLVRRKEPIGEFEYEVLTSDDPLEVYLEAAAPLILRKVVASELGIVVTGLDTALRKLKERYERCVNSRTR